MIYYASIIIINHSIHGKLCLNFELCGRNFEAVSAPVVFAERTAWKLSKLVKIQFKLNFFEKIIKEYNARALWIFSAEAKSAFI